MTLLGLCGAGQGLVCRWVLCDMTRGLLFRWCPVLGL